MVELDKVICLQLAAVGLLVLLILVQSFGGKNGK